MLKALAKLKFEVVPPFYIYLFNKQEWYLKLILNIYVQTLVL